MNVSETARHRYFDIYRRLFSIWTDGVIGGRNMLEFPRRSIDILLVLNRKQF